MTPGGTKTRDGKKCSPSLGAGNKKTNTSRDANYEQKHPSAFGSTEKKQKKPPNQMKEKTTLCQAEEKIQR